MAASTHTGRASVASARSELSCGESRNRNNGANYSPLPPLAARQLLFALKLYTHIYAAS